MSSDLRGTTEAAMEEAKEALATLATKFQVIHNRNSMLQHRKKSLEKKLERAQRENRKLNRRVADLQSKVGALVCESGTARNGLRGANLAVGEVKKGTAKPYNTEALAGAAAPVLKLSLRKKPRSVASAQEPERKKRKRNSEKSQGDADNEGQEGRPNDDESSRGKFDDVVTIKDESSDEADDDESNESESTENEFADVEDIED